MGPNAAGKIMNVIKTDAQTSNMSKQMKTLYSAKGNITLALYIT